VKEKETNSELRHKEYELRKELLEMGGALERKED